MKTILGTVISDKTKNSATVLVERKYRHPLYGKIMRLKKKLHASNEIGAKVGQKVKMITTRPISKTIAFRITEIVGVGLKEKEKGATASAKSRRGAASKAK